VLQFTAVILFPQCDILHNFFRNIHLCTVTKHDNCEMKTRKFNISNETLYNLIQYLKKHEIFFCISVSHTEADIKAVSKIFQMGLIDLKHTKTFCINLCQVYLFKENFPQLYTQPLSLHHCGYIHEFCTLKNSKLKLKGRHTTHICKGN
jgi:hypothetical protein